MANNKMILASGDFLVNVVDKGAIKSEDLEEGDVIVDVDASIHR